MKAPKVDVTITEYSVEVLIHSEPPVRVRAGYTINKDKWLAIKSVWTGTEWSSSKTDAERLSCGGSMISHPRGWVPPNKHPVGSSAHAGHESMAEEIKQMAQYDDLTHQIDPKVVESVITNMKKLHAEHPEHK